MWICEESRTARGRRPRRQRRSRLKTLVPRVRTRVRVVLPDTSRWFGHGEDCSAISALVMTPASPFKSAVPLEKRKAQGTSVRAQMPGKVPTIVERSERPGSIGSLPKAKYAVSGTAAGSGLRDAIRADAQMPSDAPLHIYLANGDELDYEAPLSLTDEAHRDEDGFLYVHVSSLDIRPDNGSGGGGSSTKQNVPYLLQLLARVRPGTDKTAASEQLTSPHGDRLPEGASVASCTFLNPRAGTQLLPELTPSNDGRVPRALYVAMLFDVTAVGLVVPLLAAYSRELGAGPRFTGLLQATYGLSQLVGANLLGGLSDTVGRKRMLQLSSLGGAVGYSCLALSLGPPGSLGLLLASRLPIGLLKQSLTVSRALVVDTTLPATRMRPMAALGGVVGIGFVLGPGFGGVLSKKAGLKAPPLLAAGLFLLAQLVVGLGLTETAPLPLVTAELRILLATARGLFDARATATATAAPASTPTADTTLPMPTATALCADLLPSWRPNGVPVPDESRAALLEGWASALHAAVAKAAMTLPGSSSTPAAEASAVSWEQFADVLYIQYAVHKVQRGMLHDQSLPALLDRRPSAAPSAASSTSEAATDGEAAAALRQAQSQGLRAIFGAARRLWSSDSLPFVRGLLLARAVVELAIMTMHATFADYTRAKFGWDQKKTGYGMAFSGALSVVVDLGVLPLLHRHGRLSELAAGLGGGGLVAGGLALVAFGSSANGFLFGLAVLSLGASLFKSALNTLVMGQARRDEAGTISGAADAMEAVCRVAAPLGGGLLLEYVSNEGPAMVGILLALVGTLALYEVAPAPHKRALIAGKTVEELSSKKRM